MPFKNLKITILFLVTLIITSCKMDFSPNSISGKGPIVEKEFKLEKSFDALQAYQGWDIELIQSENPRLVVRTQENILPVFRHEIKNGKLTISLEKNTNVKNVKVQEVKVYYTGLSEIGASSSSSVSSSEIFEQEKLTLKTSSSGAMELHIKTAECIASSSSSSKMELEGSSIDFKGQASSSAQILAGKLKTKRCELSASSSSFIKTQAFQSLVAKASSSAKLQLKAETNETSISGSSSSKIEIEGYSEELKVSASSGAIINAGSLSVENCAATASSSGSIDINVTHKLKAKTSSGGSITYSGNPLKTTLDKSSSGGKIKEK